MNKKVLKRTIILCWILLMICFIIKIFGGNFFEIACSNKVFINICYYVDKQIWLQYIIGCISSYITITLLLLAIAQKWKYDKIDYFFVIPTILIGVAIKLWNSKIGLAVDFWQCFALPFFIKHNEKTKKYIFIVIIGNILNLAFQVLSQLVKNLSIVIITNTSFLITIMFMIDIYIMLLLYYLYANYLGEKK